MKQNIFIILLIICFFVECNISTPPKISEHNIGNLVISIPNNFKFIKDKGIDSYVAYLITASQDTFHIEYVDKGIIYNLYEPSPHVLPLKDRENIIKLAGKEPTADEVLFSEYPQEDEGQRIFDKNYFMYDTINGIITKIVQPKKIGDGITGLYIPKLKDGTSFSIYAMNLDSIAHRDALKMFKMIRYK